MVRPSPSSTLVAASAADSWLSAETVQPARGRAGPIGGSPNRPISAADVQGPRLPASVSAVSRTYRPRTPPNTTVFSVLSSAQVPEVTGKSQFFPSRLTETEYRPISPLLI